MNIIEILQEHAKTYQDVPAIIDNYRGRQRTITFADLERASAQAAALLWREGLRPGDTVLVFQPMSAELYIALLAIFRLGLVAMFIDPAQGKEYIEQCCALSPPKGLIASTKAHLLRVISPALRHIPYRFVIGWPLLDSIHWAQAAQLPPHPDIFPATAETPALLTFTSGSTGQPKAALRTHGFLLAQHQALAQSLNLRPNQTDMVTMPIVTLANLASGVTSLIPKADLRHPGSIPPRSIVDQIFRNGVYSTVASPVLLERVARYCQEQRLYLPGLKKIFTGGAPVFPRLLEQLQQIAPAAEITAIYGSTEAEPMAKIAYHQMQAEDIEAMRRGQGLLTGEPVETIQLQIMSNRWGSSVGPYSSAEFESACCHGEEIGEIVVSGDHVLPGYLHGEGDKETKFRVGDTIWHRTGDAGYLDPKGRLWLLGRCAARIDDHQGELYPFAAECVAYNETEIQRAAVISHQNRRVMAIEFFEDQKTSLIGLKDTLAWSAIDEVQICEKIPVDKRHNAKIDYPALSQMLANV